MDDAEASAVDVVVVGGGVAGLAAALGCALAASPAPRVIVFDPALGRAPPPTLRAVAVSPASRRFLDRLGVWEGLAPGAQPITRMALGDTRPGAVPAPILLSFETAPEGEPLAHMVLHDPLRDALAAAAAAAGVALRPTEVTAVGPAGATIAVAGLRARLVVAADGARSRLRENARLGTVGWDYGQVAITATLDHSLDHRGEALQVFLPGGPLAFLPLRATDGSGRRSSLVWTERAAEADRLLQGSPDAFVAALLARGGHDRGELTLVDRPLGHPLALRLARNLVAPRLALLGDAARAIHPLAGQGLNLGLADAEALARAVGDAMALGLDPGAPRRLRGYERDRRPAQLAMAAATDGLNRLFSTDDGPLRAVRDLGLALVDRSPAAKRFFMRRASGLD